MTTEIHLCSFSSPAAELPKGKRTAENVLVSLSGFPRISTWDMSENPWLCDCISDLKQRGLIEDEKEPYPWHRYALTDAGKEELKIAALTGSA